MIRVVVAVVTDAEGRVLITRRSLKTSHGGFWEFPGGKIEAGEQASAAVIRELKEEVGLEVDKAEFLGEIHHSYDERNVLLQVYRVSKYRGEAQCKEDQMDLKWAEINTLQTFQFPAANSKIIELL